MDKSAKKRKDHGGKSKHKQKSESQNPSKHDKEANPSSKTGTADPQLESSPTSQYSQGVLEISQTPVDKFKKREIQSNWSKYESPLEEDTSISTNFENLMNAPISTGGHFQFKSEKNMQVDITNEYREYFSLNINKLAKNLETLPFYVRHQLDKNLFTKDEIKTMDSKCTTFERDCVEKMSKLLLDSDKSNYILNSQELTIEPGESIQMNNTVEDDLDELLDLKAPANDLSNNMDVADIIEEPALNIPKINTLNSRSNLENWLDDLLQ